MLHFFQVYLKYSQNQPICQAEVTNINERKILCVVWYAICKKYYKVRFSHIQAIQKFIKPVMV
jgi:hypothetical protein